MCLRGDINVNHLLIGEWYAQRLDDLTDVDDWHDYLCEYVNHNEAYADRFTRAVIRHRYSDGAPVLVALVLLLAEGGWD